jgi:protein TonB
MLLHEEAIIDWRRTCPSPPRTEERLPAEGMNLLDLPIAPRPGKHAYWATVIASLVIHGGFLAYVIGIARSPGQPSRLQVTDMNAALIASPPAPALPRGDREALPLERAEAPPPAVADDLALPSAEALAGRMNDALPEDHAVVALSLPLPEKMSKYRLRAGPLPATALPDRRAGAPMSLPSRRMSRVSGEQRLSERHVADPHDKIAAPAPLPPLKLLVAPGHDIPDAASDEGRAMALDMGAQGEPVVAVLPKEAGVAMLAARIIDNAPTLPEDRASPSEPEVPAESMSGAPAAAAGPSIAHPPQGKKPAVAEKSNPAKNKAKAEQSSADLKKANAYRARVRSHLAAHRPNGAGGSGSAVVAFELSPKGRVLSARIARSSGDPAMDESVVQSVHRSEPFPKPPEGMEVKQLRFVIPFEFR